MQSALHAFLDISGCCDRNAAIYAMLTLLYAAAITDNPCRFSETVVPAAAAAIAASSNHCIVVTS
jgi:hypothetical protein